MKLSPEPNQDTHRCLGLAETPDGVSVNRVSPTGVCNPKKSDLMVLKPFFDVNHLDLFQLI